MSKDYQAQIFHPSVPDGRASGHLRVTATHIDIQWADGSYQLPTNQLTLRLGGAGDRLVFFEHPAHPDWSVSTNDLDLLQDPILQQDPELAVQLSGIKRKRTGNHALLIGCAGVLVAMVIGLFALKPFAVDLIADQVPAEWETKWGDAGFAQYKLGVKLIDDPQLLQQLNALGALLTEHIDDQRFTYRFHLVEDDSLNAFAFPGGNMVVHTGAILQADQGEELLGVLAHEIAHVTQRHSIHGMVDSLGTMIILQMIIGDTSALGSLMNDVTPLLTERAFSRDNERDADMVGLGYLDAARIDPSGMRRFFQRIQETYEDSPQSAVGEQLNFLSTHPATAERIARIDTYLADRSPMPGTEVADLFNALKTNLTAYLEAPVDAQE